MVKKKHHKPYTKRFFNKKKHRCGRNYQDQAYANWRKKVKQRDDHTCQWPGCSCKHNLQVHHIKKWSTNPGLRYIVSNGITLCKYHHEQIKGNEEHYEMFFFKLLEHNILIKIRSFSRDDV